MKPLKDSEGRRVVLITYMRTGSVWLPRKVFVATQYPGFFASYDCQWSKSYGRLYYQCGDSGALAVTGYPDASRVRVKLWWDEQAAPELGATDEGLAVQRIRRMTDPLPLGRRGELNPLKYGRLGLVAWCRRCRGYRPAGTWCRCS